MRFIILLMAVILLSSFAPQDTEGFKLTLPLILAALAGCYEVVSRLIPTSKVWTIVGKVLEILTWLSNLLDRKKK
jgi:hypothetical protein